VPIYSFAPFIAAYAFSLALAFLEPEGNLYRAIKCRIQKYSDLKEVAMKHLFVVAVLGILLAGVLSFGYQMEAAEDPILRLDESIAGLKKEINSLEENLEGTNQEIAEIKKSLASINCRLISLIGKVEPLSQRLEDLEDEYQGRIAGLSRRVEDIEKEQTAGNVEIDKPNWMMWKIQAEGESYENFSLAVDMKQVEGTPGYYGILFRFSDENLYYFWVKDDGYYGLSIGMGEEWEPLVEITRTEAIKRNSWNRLGAEADGDELSLYANGELLSTTVDDRLTGGRVAVVAETASDQEYLKVLFNDFSIEELE